MYLLDTDIASLIYYGRNERLNRRYESVPATESIVLPIVTKLQILRGRYESLLKAEDEGTLLVGAERLAETERWLAGFNVLAVTVEAAKQFGTLRANKKYKKIGSADTLIAAIALANRMILVTRNVKDFSVIPGIQLENWADG
jgi:tRNA(fMet)-specific endonuclease VapC